MARPRPIAVDPSATPLNQFVSSFAGALTRAGYSVEPFTDDWATLRRVDAVLFHWPQQFLGRTGRRRAWGQLARLRIARVLWGTRVVWVTHNVGQHDAPADSPLLARAFVRSLDGLVHLSNASRRLIGEVYSLSPRSVRVVTVHGRYGEGPVPGFCAPTADEPTQLASVGLVRPYKNLDELIAAARGLDGERVRVAVTGVATDRAFADNLRRSAEGCAALALTLLNYPLSEAGLEAALDGCHGVVLPYRDILHSGSAIHALSRGRPVLVPAKGAMPELREQVGAEWVRLYEGALTTDLLRDFAEHCRWLPDGGSPDLGALDWTRVVADLMRLRQALWPEDRV